MEKVEARIHHKLEVFFSQYSQKTYGKGQMLIEEGTTPQGIFFIEEGVVKRYWISSNGDEITLNLYKPFAFLPMSWAMSNVPNTHFYAALTPVKARVAPKEAVLAFIKSEPEILYDLLRRVYIGMEGLWAHIEHITSGDAYTKLATALLILAKRFGKKESTTIVIEIPMTEKDIASYAGISRETVNRELRKLQNNHILSLEKGTITINSLQKLEDICL